MTPENGAQVDLPSSTHYIDDWLWFSPYTSMHYLNGWCHIVVVVNSHARVNARSCMNVFRTSDSMYYGQRSTVGCVTSCFSMPHQLVGFLCNWWAFLFEDNKSIMVGVAATVWRYWWLIIIISRSALISRVVHGNFLWNFSRNFGKNCGPSFPWCWPLHNLCSLLCDTVHLPCFVVWSLAAFHDVRHDRTMITPSSQHHLPS